MADHIGKTTRSRDDLVLAYFFKHFKTDVQQVKTLKHDEKLDIYVCAGNVTLDTRSQDVDTVLSSLVQEPWFRHSYSAKNVEEVKEYDIIRSLTSRELSLPIQYSITTIDDGKNFEVTARLAR